jgi:hypothetical protein
MKTLILLTIITTILLLSGCGNMTPEEMKNTILEANTALDTYKIDSVMNSETKTKFNNVPVQIINALDTTSMVDKTAKKLSGEGSLVTIASGKQSSVPVEIYLIDQTMYSHVQANWIKIEIDQDIWNQQDALTQITTFLASGSIEILEDEEDYHVVLIQPDIKELVRVLLKMQNQQHFFNENINFTDIIRGYNSTLWINKETFVIEKMVTESVMVLNSDNLGLDVEDEGLTMRTVIEAKIYDIGEEMDIELPEEALEAIDMKEIQAKMTGGNYSRT